MRYIFAENFQLTVFDLDGCEILVPRVEYDMAAINLPQPVHAHANVPIPVIEIEDSYTDDDDTESDPGYFESMDDESVDVSSVLTDSGSDVVSGDEMFDEEELEDTDSPEYKKVDPDYQPIQFVWKFDRRFRLTVAVANASRIDMTMEMRVQNLEGVDTTVKFRAEKHGRGFRYYALEWGKKFTKPNQTV